MKGIIKFKNDTIAHNFCDVSIHPKLTDIILWIVNLTGEMIITSARRYRSLHKNDSGIHLTDPLRAVDCRYYIYSDPHGLVDLINKHFQYDKRRPDLQCAVFHDIISKHIHLQVHDRTKQII